MQYRQMGGVNATLRRVEMEALEEIIANGEVRSNKKPVFYVYVIG